MMKKGISFLLTFSVLCSLLVPAALAYDGGGTENLDQSYSAVKERVSEIYGIPNDILETLDEEYVRSLDASPDQVIGSEKNYIKFSTDESGKPVAEVKTYNDYLNECMSLYADDNPKEDELFSGWLEVRLTVIQDSDTEARCAAVFDWAIDPSAYYKLQDIMAISFQNGTYSGEASGFHSFKEQGENCYPEVYDASDFQNYSTAKRFVYLPIQLEEYQTDHFFFMSVKVVLDSDSNADRIFATYYRQTVELDWESVISSGINLVSAFVVRELTGGAVSVNFIPEVAKILGSIEESYVSDETALTLTY